MEAATSIPFSSKTLKLKISIKTEFLSSSNPLHKPLKSKPLSCIAASSGGALNARMVASTTSIKAPISLDFETSVFNNEKVALSGHGEISFAAKEIDLVEWKGDILAVGATEKDLARDEDSKFQNPLLQKLDSKLGGLLTEASSDEDFSGKSGQSTILRIPGLGSKRIALVGLGSSTSSIAAYRSLGEAVAAAAKSAQASNIAVALASTDGLSAESKLSSASAIATGALLGIFEDTRFKSESKKPTLKSLDILGLGTGSEIEKKLKRASDVCAGVILDRELVNAPANVLTLAVLADEAKKIASTYSDVFSANILDVEQCKELKMGSYVAVNEASANLPHFIHLCYKPSGGEIKKKTALVGKGLTFDSGGYSIKTGPRCSIELMKFDMGGAAAVLGAAKALGQIKPAGVEEHFIVAACENMISGTGMRPGSPFTFATTLEQEYRSDIFGERGKLLGAVHVTMEPLFRRYMENGMSKGLAYKNTVNIFRTISTKGLLIVSNSLSKDAKRVLEALSASNYPCPGSTALTGCCFYEGHSLPMAKINPKSWTVAVQVLSKWLNISAWFGATPVRGSGPQYLLVAFVVGVCFKLLMDSRWFCHLFRRHPNIPVCRCDTMMIESTKSKGDKPKITLKEDVLKVEMSFGIHVNTKMIS